VVAHDVAPLDARIAAGWLAEAKQHLDRGRLVGSMGSQQSEDGAARYRRVSPSAAVLRP
jgi:hypothetical protein